MPSEDLVDQDAGLDEAKESSSGGSPDGAARGLVAWIAAHRFRVILIGGTTALIVIVIASFMLISAPRTPQFDETAAMEQVLQELDRRNFAEAQLLAGQLKSREGISAQQLGGPAFVLGAVAAYEADASTGKDREKMFLLAARYLEEANKRGFPADRQAEGLYLLGKSLFECGRIAACRGVLIESAKISPRYRAEIFALLAESYLNESPPNYELALAQNSQLLSEKDLSQTKRQAGLIQRAQILLRMGKIDQCKAALDQIPAGEKNPGVAVERAEALMYEARELSKKTPPTDEDRIKSREKLQQAIETMRFIQEQETENDRAARQALYLTGMCYLEMGDARAAAEQFFRVHGLYPYTPEGLASGVQAADIYLRQGRDVEALSEYRRVAARITDPALYSNSWIPLAQLKSRYLAAYQHYLGERKFEIALQFTRLMQRLFPSDEVLVLQAETLSLWGQTLLGEADKGPRDKAEAIRRLGREQFRRAGTCYARLAKILPANRNYTDQVWNGATAFLKGQDYSNAARMFQVYLKNEAQRRHPLALVNLGEALLSLGQLDKALEAFKECINLYPRDTASSSARMLASRTYEEKGDWRNAESMLMQNLGSDYLTPESQEWRESLMELGELLHSEGRYSDAARRLDEAAQRYPDLPETIQARYLTADCYYKKAAAIEDQLNKNPTGGSGDILVEQVKDLYSKALEQYKQVQETLAKGRDKAELTAMQKAMLRNCYFAIGDVLFAQGDYESAVKAYATAANRYQGDPESLNAYVQMAAAYRKLDKPQDARKALEQAKFALGRMKSDVAFEKTTNYSRKQWTERLDVLLSL